MPERLIVFSDDWGRHPSSCQYLVRQLLGRCEVTWINTIGTRRPLWNWATVRRGLEKMRDWRAPVQVAGGQRSPELRNPKMWPGFHRPWFRRWNGRLLARCLRSSGGPRIEEAVVLSTLPIVADLIGVAPVRRWVYYCVDDLSAWPGLDGGMLREMEQLLVERADRLVAAGENLASRLRSKGREPTVITHGVDVSHWSCPSAVTAGRRRAWSEIPQPRVLFWGLLDRRLDVAWLDALGHALSEGSLVLVGPVQNPDPALSRVPRVYQPGRFTVEELSWAAAHSDVLIMPYADLPVTRAMQPLKLKEYLATGKPVVVRRLPAVEDWCDCLDAADTAAAFVRQVRERIHGGIPAGQQVARRRLAKEDWASKAEAMARVLFEQESAWNEG